ncbi:hypothetical protein EDD16DRAFT_1474240 [Pisolithus croceorrhizus]|nr:hypothetical protein EV401DRAFT_1864872 [Pisolithus croceorrhizus]KAI6125638.1 hypothetical protein EDD16DRAFT_1474240 [Pisolithus croceorrhizus]KAI6169257.1 hypothetical protein EDD17DRAFT_1526419 [Pisolithus thermaeus]
MYRLTVLRIVLTALLCSEWSLATQVPLNVADDPGAGVATSGPDTDLMHWNFEDLPNPNATGHLVFETVHSLLQHWPNTRMRNGHTVVPGTIPIGTYLYHATNRHHVPTTPDWVAMHPEESTIFCMGPPENGCWHLTLVTTRPLKVLYFDGNSAAKLDSGTMDTQDVLTWGKVLPEKTWMEQERIAALCEWGNQHGVDGFVRMEMDFEAMICNFTSGLDVVSFLHLASPDALDVPPVTGSRAFLRAFESLHGGSWSNRFPGELHVQLDLSNIVSFYDTDLVPSLVPARFGKERWDHRVLNISDEDLLRAKTRVEEELVRPRELSSGVDWMALIRTIVHRYASRLELMRYLLGSIAWGNPGAILGAAGKTQVQLRVSLMSHILLNAAPLERSNSLDWARPIFESCATSHTARLEGLNMTPSEKLLFQAVRETTKEICRIVTGMWASGVLAGLDDYLNPKKDLNITAITHLTHKWEGDVNRLMQWLDWNVWVKCRPECSIEETCYLSTWPVGFPLGEMPPPSPPGEDGPYMPSPGPFPFPDTAPDWRRPQPRCVRRVEPYTF